MFVYLINAVKAGNKGGLGTLEFIKPVVKIVAESRHE